MKYARLPLLLLLAGLTIAFLSVPAPAEASGPSCGSSSGHYWGSFPIMGTQSSTCGLVQWCRVGTNYCEWDCVSDGHGGYNPANVSCLQTFSFCQANQFKCM